MFRPWVDRDTKNIKVNGGHRLLPYKIITKPHGVILIITEFTLVNEYTVFQIKFLV